MYTEPSREPAGTFLRELLSRPAFKDDVRAVLNSMSGPDTGRDLARTFLWQDLEFSLGIMGGLPALANGVIRLFDEVLSQVNEKFPPELLNGFVGSLLNDIDKQTLGTAIRKLRPVIDNLAPLFIEAWQEATREGERP